MTTSSKTLWMDASMGDALISNAAESREAATSALAASMDSGEDTELCKGDVGSMGCAGVDALVGARVATADVIGETMPERLLVLPFRRILPARPAPS